MISKAKATFPGSQENAACLSWARGCMVQSKSENIFALPSGKKKESTEERQVSGSKGRKKKERNIYILPELLTRFHNGMQQVRKCRSFQLDHQAPSTAQPRYYLAPLTSLSLIYKKTHGLAQIPLKLSMSAFPCKMMFHIEK